MLIEKRNKTTQARNQRLTSAKIKQRNKLASQAITRSRIKKKAKTYIAINTFNFSTRRPIESTVKHEKIVKFNNNNISKKSKILGKISSEEFSLNSSPSTPHNTGQFIIENYLQNRSDSSYFNEFCNSSTNASDMIEIDQIFTTGGSMRGVFNPDELPEFDCEKEGAGSWGYMGDWIAEYSSLSESGLQTTDVSRKSSFDANTKEFEIPTCESSIEIKTDVNARNINNCHNYNAEHLMRKIDTVRINLIERVESEIDPS